MVLVYAERLTPRLEYAFRLIFEQILRLEVSFTANSAEYAASEQPRINYSSTQSGGGLYMYPSRLLFLDELEYPEPDTVLYNGEKYFYGTSPESFLPFDPFAASFLLVTRMEEYYDTRLDHFGRFIPKNSLLSHNGLLQKPVVNIWALLVAEKLSEKYPFILLPKQHFNFITTVDIDSAWAYLNKGLFRNLGGFARDFLKGRFKEAFQRVKVQLGIRKDPFDTYDFLDTVFKENENRVIFFFLMGDRCKHDKSINHRNHAFHRLIRRISSKYKTGIHPSLNGSREDFKKWLPIEKKRLERITRERVTRSKQHFLYLTFPKTYQVLRENKITSDYTMGYSGECGFRAGICSPYPYYDLTREKVTGLTIYPFQVMDVTLRDYLGLDAERAAEMIWKLMDEVRKVRGTFISTWHNESLNGNGKWKGYRNVFRQMNKTGFQWAND